MLVVGPRHGLDDFVRAALPSFETPTQSITCGGTLALDDVRTLILKDVDKLDAAGQRLALSWTDRPADTRPRVVSLSCVTLFPLVESGRFSEELYYRLNTVYLTLNSVQH